MDYLCLCSRDEEVFRHVLSRVDVCSPQSTRAPSSVLQVSCPRVLRDSKEATVVFSSRVCCRSFVRSCWCGAAVCWVCFGDKMNVTFKGHWNMLVRRQSFLIFTFTVEGMFVTRNCDSRSWVFTRTVESCFYIFSFLSVKQMNYQ